MMDEGKKRVAVVGGGAAGLACAVMLADCCRVTVFERNDRVGKKLSATGNGQGNVTNTDMGPQHYFSDDGEKVAAILSRFGWRDTVAFLESMGGIFLPDVRGRVYPAGRQASAVTDLFRKTCMEKGVCLMTGCRVDLLQKSGHGFMIRHGGGEETADAVVLAAGGMAAPNFGTDGSAYALARDFGHTVTACTPSLVQLRCDPRCVRGLKGIRNASALTLLRAGREICRMEGDVLFTESGISGDAAFRISPYVRAGDELKIDLLPSVTEERLLHAMARAGDDPLLCIVPNGLARVLARKTSGDVRALARLVKAFPLTVTGTLGFSYAQVTKGGIPLQETDASLMSRLCRGLYFAGEILNVDGECGGYNLQWAFASAAAVSRKIAGGER